MIEDTTQDTCTTTSDFNGVYARLRDLKVSQAFSNTEMMRTHTFTCLLSVLAGDIRRKMISKHGKVLALVVK